MGTVNEFKQAFESIKSQVELARFAEANAMARTSTSGSSCIYSGTTDERVLEVRERWWDPSSVYAAQRDKHEAVLTVDGTVVATIRFQGDS